MRTKRRTEKEKEEIRNLKESIITRSKSFEITSYELAKAVNMTIPGIEKILNGITKLPYPENLKQLDEYIADNYEKVDQVAEPQQEYLDKKSEEYENIMKSLQKIEDKIDRNALKQDIIFEIINNAKAAELAFIEKAIKERFSSLQE